MLSSRLYSVALLAIFFLTLCALTGCSEDEPADLSPDPPVIQPPIDPEALMQNFAIIYEDMLLDELGDFLHPDFHLALLPGTIADWGLPQGTTVEKDQMLRIHGNMFSGQQGSNEYGDIINPLDNIEVSLFERTGLWINAPVDDPLFTGTKMAPYAVRLFFMDNTGGHAFEVSQAMNFYVGQTEEGWYLQGIEGIQVKGTQATSYCSMLYLYNTVPEKPLD